VSSDAPIEIELKLALPDSAGYDTVRGWLDAEADLVAARSQQNLYLDTADLRLRGARAMLRVRVEPDAVRATLKTKARLQDGLMCSVEHEASLDAELAARFRRAPPSRLDPRALPIAAAVLPLLLAADEPEPPRLHVLGALWNERRSYRLDRRLLDGQEGTIPFDLDRCLGPSGVPRLELELEHPDAAAFADDVYARLLALGVLATPSEQSKYSYFLEGLEATGRDEPSEA
jgi:uncharacterized protein YjbK